MASRSTTPSAPGRPKLPFERIVRGALDIVDDQGADALTLRRLAESLGSSTATLYRHVSGRAELVGHVIEHVYGEVDVDPDALAGMPWPLACEQIAKAIFAAVARHPNLAPLLAEAVPTGPHAMALRELSLSVLLAGGLSPAEARTFTATLGRFVIGFATQLHDDPEHRAAEARAGARLVAADPHLYPATRATASADTVPLEEEFAFGLDLLIRGMRQAVADAA